MKSLSLETLNRLKKSDRRILLISMFFSTLLFFGLFHEVRNLSAGGPNPGDPCTTTIYCCCNQTSECSSPYFQCGSITVPGVYNSDLNCDATQGCNWDDPGIQCVLNESCGGPSCDACACEAPTGMSWVAPASGSTIVTGTVIDWNPPSDWGIDGGESGSGCSGCSYSGNGYYKLFIAGIDQTSRCQEASGNILTSSQCTISSVDPAWIGTTQTFNIRAHNECGNQEINRNFSFPENQRPFCSEFQISGGRLINGVLGVRDEEQFSITVNGGETDPYGPPDIDYCYAISAQPEPRQWICNRIATNGTSGIFTSTYNTMKAQFAGNPYYNQIDTLGFTTTANIGDNLSSNFCNGWGMYIPEEPVIGACDGGTCTLTIRNSPPEIQSVGDVSGWIGTSPDNDNGLSCQDNNPAVYTMTVTDADGSFDVDRVDFSLADPAHIADGNNDNVWDSPVNGRYWPLRILFAQKMTATANQEFANGTFFVRDTAVESNTPSNQWCLDQNQGMHPIDPTGWDTSNPNISRNARFTQPYTVWCYGYDDHSWDDVPILTNQTLNGVSVDVYYLRNDIVVDNEGHPTRLKADSVWQNSSYVAYERNGGDRVFVRFVVEYLPDGAIDNWSGQYRNIWFVNDLLGRDDSTENLPGEYMADDQWGNSFHISGTTRIDLTLPSLTLQDPSPISASRLEIDWSSTDATSGIDRIYGEANSTANPDPSNVTNIATGQSYDLTQHPPASTPPPLSSPFLWNRDLNGNSENGSETIEIGDNEEGSINFESFVQDNACNLNGTQNQANLSLPWILSKGGLVYSQEAPDIDIKPLDPSSYPNTDPISAEFNTYPFNINKWEVGLSSELLASGQDISSQHLPYSSNTNAFGLENYSDLNNRPWYNDLKNNAENQIASDPGRFSYVSGIGGNLGGAIGAVSNGSSDCTDGSKICVIEASSININNPSNTLICDRKSAIFISGDLTINSDVNLSGESNGCIFIVQGNVSIQPGSYKSGSSTYPRYDIINGFIISDGIITVQEDSQEGGNGYRDGLKVRGSLLGFGDRNTPSGSSLIFDRSLKLLDNLIYPSVVIHHDSRYYDIAEQTIGGNNETYKKEIGIKP